MILHSRLCYDWHHYRVGCAAVRAAEPRLVYPGDSDPVADPVTGRVESAGGSLCSNDRVKIFVALVIGLHRVFPGAAHWFEWGLPGESIIHYCILSGVQVNPVDFVDCLCSKVSWYALPVFWAKYDPGVLPEDHWYGVCFSARVQDVNVHETTYVRINMDFFYIGKYYFRHLS